MFHSSYLNKLIELVNVINILHSSKFIVNIRSIDVKNLILRLVSYAACDRTSHKNFLRKKEA